MEKVKLNGLTLRSRQILSIKKDKWDTCSECVGVQFRDDTIQIRYHHNEESMGVFLSYVPDTPDVDDYVLNVELDELDGDELPFPVITTGENIKLDRESDEVSPQFDGKFAGYDVKINISIINEIIDIVLDDGHGAKILSVRAE